MGAEKPDMMCLNTKKPALTRPAFYNQTNSNEAYEIIEYQMSGIPFQWRLS